MYAKMILLVGKLIIKQMYQIINVKNIFNT
jgi:hypothetical protein